MAKRFGTPVKSNIPPKVWSTPTSSSTLELTGYIVLIGTNTFKSQAGNMYFEIVVKIGEQEYEKVRVMVKGDERRQFRTYKFKALKLTVSSGKGIIFFNKSRKSAVELLKYKLDFDASIPIVPLDSIETNGPVTLFVKGTVKWLEDERLVKGFLRVRKCLLKDYTGNGECPLSIWHDNIDHINNDSIYLFSDVELSTFYGIELTCTKKTVIEGLGKNEEIVWEEDKLKFYSSKGTNEVLLCCPMVTSVGITETLTCPNPACKKVVVCNQADKVAKCKACSRKINPNVKKSFNGLIEMEKDEEKYSLSFNIDILHNTKRLEFDGEPASYEDMEDAMILLTNADFLFDSNNSKLIEIKDHVHPDEMDVDNNNNGLGSQEQDNVDPDEKGVDNSNNGLGSQALI